MMYRVNLLWKVLVPLGSCTSNFVHQASILYNENGGRRFVRSLGGDFHFDQAPVVLAPTDLLHKALRSTREQLNLEGNRFPYSFYSTRIQQRTRVNITLHRHGYLLCATIRLDCFETDVEPEWSALQDLKHDETLWPLVQKLLVLVISGNLTVSLSNEPQILPAIHIEAFDADIPNWQSQLVSLVTRHVGVNDSVVSEVLQKNQTHRIDETCLLIDKQGIAAYVPTGADTRAITAIRGRFEHAAAMLQLAAVLRRQLRDGCSLPEDLQLAVLDPTQVILASVSGLRIWSLFVLEFSLQIWLKKSEESVRKYVAHQSKGSLAPISIDSSDSTKEILRILIVTVTSVESAALHTALTEKLGRKPVTKRIEGFIYQNFGTYGDYEVIHQISGVGSGGTDGSQESVRRSISAIKPSAVLMVGIAFGVDEEKQPIGTIMVSKQIQNYEPQRINQDASIELRGDKVTASSLLLNWVSHAEIAWGERSPKIQKGLILSGEKLIDNEEFRDNLAKLTAKPIGGEMEGAGLYAACQSARVDWLLVKAVCDWADGKKHEDKDSRQFIAAKASAEFAVHLLRSTSEKPV